MVDKNDIRFDTIIGKQRSLRELNELQYKCLKQAIRDFGGKRMKSLIMMDDVFKRGNHWFMVLKREVEGKSIDCRIGIFLR
ncbi:hypothetical protein [Paenibacillus macquariensis]|uniref:hypothetical protein n=1 Tax=Paenibacillus macquariensis TaxID=948756 RepID=UPI0014722875|nr:hypothetical protein [Paenibacillus macquariensis]MEC0094383.1 hypothetical protein [Paenibacillus macquariensis]